MQSADEEAVQLFITFLEDLNVQFEQAIAKADFSSLFDYLKNCTSNATVISAIKGKNLPPRVNTIAETIRKRAAQFLKQRGILFFQNQCNESYFPGIVNAANALAELDAFLSHQCDLVPLAYLQERIKRRWSALNYLLRLAKIDPSKHFAPKIVNMYFPNNEEDSDSDVDAMSGVTDVETLALPPSWQESPWGIKFCKIISLLTEEGSTMELDKLLPEFRLASKPNEESLSAAIARISEVRDRVMKTDATRITVLIQLLKSLFYVSASKNGFIAQCHQLSLCFNDQEVVSCFGDGLYVELAASLEHLNQQDICTPDSDMIIWLLFLQVNRTMDKVLRFAVENESKITAIKKLMLTCPAIFQPSTIPCAFVRFYEEFYCNQEADLIWLSEQRKNAFISLLANFAQICLGDIAPENQSRDDVLVSASDFMEFFIQPLLALHGSDNFLLHLLHLFCSSKSHPKFKWSTSHDEGISASALLSQVKEIWFTSEGQNAKMALEAAQCLKCIYRKLNDDNVLLEKFVSSNLLQEMKNDPWYFRYIICSWAGPVFGDCKLEVPSTLYNVLSDAVKEKYEVINDDRDFECFYTCILELALIEKDAALKFFQGALQVLPHDYQVTEKIAAALNTALNHMFCNNAASVALQLDDVLLSLYDAHVQTTPLFDLPHYPELNYDTSQSLRSNFPLQILLRAAQMAQWHAHSGQACKTFYKHDNPPSPESLAEKLIIMFSNAASRCLADLQDSMPKGKEFSESSNEPTVRLHDPAVIDKTYAALFTISRGALYLISNNDGVQLPQVIKIIEEVQKARKILNEIDVAAISAVNGKLPNDSSLMSTSTQPASASGPKGGSVDISDECIRNTLEKSISARNAHVPNDDNRRMGKLPPLGGFEGRNAVEGDETDNMYQRVPPSNRDYYHRTKYTSSYYEQESSFPQQSSARGHYGHQSGNMFSSRRNEPKKLGRNFNHGRGYQLSSDHL